MSWIDTIDNDFGHWLAGFVDGEGSFTITRNLLENKPYYHVRFSIGQRADDATLLEFIRTSLGMGKVFYGKGRHYTHDGKDGYSNPKAEYAMTARADCERIILLFGKYPLRSKKRRDFEIWKLAVREHRLNGGYENVQLAKLQEMLRDVRKYNAAEPEMLKPIIEQLSFA